VKLTQIHLPFHSCNAISDKSLGAEQTKKIDPLSETGAIDAIDPGGGGEVIGVGGVFIDAEPELGDPSSLIAAIILR
jgi:hypothetical protein